MKVMLLGNGSREHAMGWALTKNPDVALFSVPGNPGLASLGTNIAIRADDPIEVTGAAVELDVDLVVVGPEAPLAAGVVDALEAKGIPALGPVRSAARLESSKAYAKEVMQKAGIPTAASASFSDRDAAIAYLDQMSEPFVVKADGLAAGKGVLVTDSRVEATRWVDRCLDGGFGDAGATVVVEDYLDGPEFSVFALCDGATAVAFGSARDHKRLSDGDAGPNTGGMGAFSPVDGLGDGEVADVMVSVIHPTLQQLASDDVPYRGFLYAGLVMTEDGPKVLEFNCRLGDPETQVVLPLLSSDLASTLMSAATGHLAEPPAWTDQAAVNVVLAASGYPEAPRRGDVISGIETSMALIFQGGTAQSEEGLVTDGGRVLSVVGLGDDINAARDAAYDAVGSIHFDGMHFRSDIAEEQS